MKRWTDQRATRCSITDKTWCEPGSGFSCTYLDWVGVKAGLGICMDLNPREFVAPWTAYEFASYHRRQGTQLVVFASAWCDRHPDDDPAAVKPVSSIDTINYWGNRLVPLLGREAYFVAADRVGSEALDLYREGARGRTVFCGSSCAVSLREPRLIADPLDTASEGVLLVEVPIGVRQATLQAGGRSADRGTPGQ